MERLILGIEQQIFYINCTNNRIPRLTVNRKTGIAGFPIELNNLIVGGIHMEKRHIDSRDHDILCKGIIETEYIGDHLKFIVFDRPFFQAHIHQRLQFIFCDPVSFGIGIHSHKLKNTGTDSFDHKDDRCQNAHQHPDKTGIGQRQLQ